MTHEGSSISPVSHGSGQRETKSPPSKRSSIATAATKQEILALPTNSAYSRQALPTESGMVSSDAFEQRTSRHDAAGAARRKETARRQLMGSIYSKHDNVRRSFFFVAGERPQVDVRFPRVFYKDKQEKEKGKVAVSMDTTVSSPQTVGNPRKKLRRKSDNASITSKSLTHDYSRETKPASTLRRTQSQKVNLPGIIMDFNMGANLVATGRGHEHVTSDTISDDDNERMFGISYEDYLKRPSHLRNNPCRGKYRPVTPGLLDSLNKQKVSSKVKTEQWVKSCQTSKKSYYMDSYRIGNIDSPSRMGYPNWIYTDS